MAVKPIHVALTPLDHLHKPNYLNLSYYFPLRPDVAPREVFQDLARGLRKTFYKVPWLGGKIYNQAPGTSNWRPGQRELRYLPVSEDGPLPHQLLYEELDSELTYADLKEEGFPSDAFEEEELLAVPVEGDLVAGCDVVVAKANFIPGGCILCMSTNHAAVDGTGMVIAMKLWADNTRSLYDPDFALDDLPPESSDRSLIDRLWREESAGRVPADADDWTRGLVGVRQVSSAEAVVAEAAAKERNNPAKTPSGRKPTNRTFYISAAAQAALRKECDAAVGANVLSSGDIVTALMWRGLVRARARAAAASGTALSETSVLESAINGRNDFSQAIPPDYLGNITFYNQAELPLSDVVDTSVNLGHVAQAIRAGAGIASSAALHDAYALIRNLPDYDLLRPRFRYMGGSADLLVSNLLLFPVDDIAFAGDKFRNGGRPEAVRCFLGLFNDHARVSFVLPRRTPGGIEISMNLYEDEMEHLMDDEEFGRYCMPL
ncbi:hypothetical protein F4677DRAFT_433460 [Hypoxylon crocopeplum]|nr:hypothetical protein F4677DRAFT_433460 [Hypoxylon crocopeplum]